MLTRDGCRNVYVLDHTQAAPSKPAAELLPPSGMDAQARGGAAPSQQVHMMALPRAGSATAPPAMYPWPATAAAAKAMSAGTSPTAQQQGVRTLTTCSTNTLARRKYIVAVVLVVKNTRGWPQVYPRSRLCTQEPLF